jgi:NADH dehydrogenase
MKSRQPQPDPGAEPRLVIVGGGFAGIWAAIGAAAKLHEDGACAAITLVSADPWMTIRPRLYERAPGELRVPLAELLAEIDAELAIARVASVDPGRRKLILEPGDAEVDYDALILATGSHLASGAIAGDRGIHDADTLGAAARLWRAIDESSQAQPRVTVIGGGFTGIELAAEIASEIAVARVTLLDPGSEIGSGYEPAARAEIAAALDGLGVSVRLGARATALDGHTLTLADGSAVRSDISILCGGLAASQVPISTGPDRDRLGRLVVDAQLSVPFHTGLFAAGDAAAIPLTGRVAPMSCQLAIPSGRAAGRNAAAQLIGGAPERFEYEDYVTCLDLGSAGALFTTGWERRSVLRGAEGKKRKRLINQTLIYPPHQRGPMLAFGGSTIAGGGRIGAAAAGA